MAISQSFDGNLSQHYFENSGVLLQHISGLHMHANWYSSIEAKAQLSTPGERARVEALEHESGRLAGILFWDQYKDTGYRLAPVNDEGEEAFELVLPKSAQFQAPSVLISEGGDEEWILPEEDDNPYIHIFRIPRLPVDESPFNLEAKRRAYVFSWNEDGEESRSLTQTRSFHLLPRKKYKLKHIIWDTERQEADLREMPDPEEHPQEYQDYWNALGASQDQPVLMIVHGLLGKISKKFLSPLFQDTGFMQSLHEKYGNRIIGFEHPTVLEDPEKNASSLQDQFFKKGIFPSETPHFRMDILTRSRGALVARCLLELNGRVDELPFSVDRLVMLAGANQGTPTGHPRNIPLATGRLILKLSNAKYKEEIGSVQGSRSLGRTFAEQVDDVADEAEIIALIAKGILARKDATRSSRIEDCPGISAHHSDSEFLKRLNQSMPPGNTKYYAIAANFDPDKLTQVNARKRRKLKKLMAKIFESLENDGMVPTKGVSGQGHLPADEFTFVANTSSTSAETASFGRQGTTMLAKVQDEFTQRFAGVFVTPPGPTHHESLFLNIHIRDQIRNFLLEQDLDQPEQPLIV